MHPPPPPPHLKIHYHEGIITSSRPPTPKNVPQGYCVVVFIMYSVLCCQLYYVYSSQIADGAMYQHTSITQLLSNSFGTVTCLLCLCFFNDLFFWIQYILLIYFCIVIIIFRNGHFCIVMNQGKLLTGVKMLCLYSVENKSLEKGNRKTKSFSICILPEGCILQQRMVTVGGFFLIVLFLFLAFFIMSSSHSFSSCFHMIQQFRQQLIFLNRLYWRTKLF